MRAILLLPLLGVLACDRADPDPTTSSSARSAIAAEAGSYACRAVGDLPGAERGALPDRG